jgi:2-keto-4-pentenoate hydratase/2-oxohepta-3-ene-1,7-dioic acid hydratase in catechol pathway
MQFTSFTYQGKTGLGIADGSSIRGVLQGETDLPVALDQIIAGGSAALAEAGAKLKNGRTFAAGEITYLAPFANPGKIVCLGLNYKDHAAEGGFDTPTYPALFNRFPSSLIAHNAPLIRPKVSTMFDYEGELVAVIGKPGRHISKENALDHIIGYSIFNDASVRDYQFKTAQWSIGKNFDGTGAFGPTFVSADELPPGAAGLKLQTRLDGQVLQEANTTDMVFDVATTVALLSECFVLQTGDVLVMGTPAGVGFARSPKVFMHAGQVAEIEIEGLGILRNPVVDEA